MYRYLQVIVNSYNKLNAFIYEGLLSEKKVRYRSTGGQMPNVKRSRKKRERDKKKKKG